MPYYAKQYPTRKGSWNNGDATLRTIGIIIISLIVLLVAILMLGAVLSWIYGIKMGTHSDALREILILNTELSKPSEFISAANLIPGKSISAIDLKGGKELMEKLRWVKSVEISVDRFRGKLELNVIERKPIAKVIIDEVGTTQWLCDDASLQNYLPEDKAIYNKYQLFNLPIIKFKDPSLITDTARRKNVLEIIDLADIQAKGQVKEIIFEPRNVVNLICTYGTLVKLGNNPNRANQFAILPKALRKIPPIYNRQIIIDLTAGIDPTVSQFNRSYYRYVWLPEHLHNMYGQEELKGKTEEAAKVQKPASASKKGATSSKSTTKSAKTSGNKPTTSKIPPKPQVKPVTPNNPKPKIKKPSANKSKGGGIPPPPSGL